MDGDDMSQSIEHEHEFFSIMESFGHSFLQSDITVFKLNLVSIEALNSKHKLYSKVGSIHHVQKRALLKWL